ncbi:hypothetical protein AMTRI_Chr04g188390 [Amborella trichopoda]
MASVSSLMFLFIFPAVISSITAVTDNSCSDFIRTSCNATLYPSVCYDSLSPYADSIKQNPRKLAQAAISVSLKSARNASSLANRLARSSPDDGALKDCADTLADAVDLIKRSAHELGRLRRSSFGWQLSNIQSWLSAGMTDDDTCLDEFDDSTGDSGLSGRVSDAMKVTGYALAFVNNLATSQVKKKGNRP